MKIPNFTRRFLAMIVGNVGIGVGIGLFKLSLMGNDPSTAFVIAVADRVGMDFSVLILFINAVYFIFEFLFGRKLIGIGTLFNWVVCGPIGSWTDRTWRLFFGAPETLRLRLLIMAAGILVVSFGCAFYQASALGISPYDSLSLIITERSKKPYFACRILTDGLCTLTAFLLGGIVGIGTLVCAFGLGPFIAFFTKHAAEPLIGSGT